MGCRRTRSRIVAWLDQELQAHEAQRIHDHLAGCPSCQAHASLLRATEPRPSCTPDDVGEAPVFDKLLTRVLDQYDHLDAKGLAFHREHWWPSEVRIPATHAVVYAAVLVTALGWAWVNHLEVQEAVAAKDLLIQILDRSRFTVASSPTPDLSWPVLQPTPLWTTTSSPEQLYTTNPATNPLFRTVDTTPYRGTF